jgi:hypothetical protein
MITDFAIHTVYDVIDLTSEPEMLTEEQQEAMMDQLEEEYPDCIMIVAVSVRIIETPKLRRI